jgi:hypothetical protein
MANRYPLIIDVSDGNKIKELPADDNLYLRNNSIEDVQDINALGTINAAAITIAGQTIEPQTLLDLVDTPNTYEGFSESFVKVNSSGTGIIFQPSGELGNVTVNFVNVTGEIFPNNNNFGRVGQPSQRFYEMHSQYFIGNLKSESGSVVFDAVTGKISYAALQGAPTALSEFTNDMGFLDAAGINEAISNALAGTSFDTDLNGSVFGDDSTLLVDGVNSVLKTYTLEQVGATNGQALVWSDSNQRWQPGAAVGAGVDLTAFSVGSEGTATGNGSLTYENTTGVFTYTPPDLENFGNITAESITADNLEFTGVGVVTIESGSNLVLNAANGAGNIVASSSRITDVADPIGLQDAATKSYVDAVFIGGGVAFYEGDMKGSVFANDSSLIIDGNNSQIYVEKVTYGDGTSVNYQDNTLCPAVADTVVYTTQNQYGHAIRLFVIVEGYDDAGGFGAQWETQACDIIAVRGYNTNTVTVSAFGITYSGPAPLATFDGQWNATTNRIEITCRPTSTANSVNVSVHALEMLSND